MDKGEKQMTFKGICCERFYKIGIKEGRLDRDNEILKIINGWYNSLNISLDCLTKTIHDKDFEKLKQQLTKEKNKLEYINRLRLEIIKKNIKEIQDNPILMNKLNKWIKELEK